MSFPMSFPKLLAVVALLAACGGPEGPAVISGRAPAVPSTIAISGAPSRISVGDTLLLTATVADQFGGVIPGATVGWRSSNPSVLVVEGNGRVLAVAAGATSVTATVGAAVGQIELTVYPPPPTPARIELRAARTSLTVGDTVRLLASVRDQFGQEMPERVVSWRSTDVSRMTVATDGLATAIAAGPVSVLASIGQLEARIDLVIAPPPSIITTVQVSASRTTLLVGDTLRLTATVRDQFGAVMTNTAVEWRTSDPTRLTATTSGVVSALSPGPASVIASAGGKDGRLELTVEAPPLRITSISPDTMRAGSSVAIALTWVPPGESVTVTVNGVPASVVRRDGSIVTVLAPSSTSCTPVQLVDVQVRAADRTTLRQHPLQSRSAIELRSGQVRDVLTPEELECLVLPPGEGHYFLLPYNANPTGTSASVHVTGQVSGGTRAAAIRPPERAAMAAGHTAAPRQDRHLKRRNEDSVAFHDAMRRARREQPTARQATVGRAAAVLPAGVSGVVGGVSTVRWRSGVSCNDFATISGRTVAVGDRVVIVEDGTAPLTGRINEYWQWYADEFESRILPMLNENFGNLFARDVSRSEKLLVIATPRVNAAGAAGFGPICDFWPRTVNAASNEMTTVYLSVPESESARAWWQTYMPGVLAHEAFHALHLGERLSRTEGLNAWEESWIAEGMAELAVELYHRRRCNWLPRSDVGFTAIRNCESREAAAGRPLAALGTFAFGLREYLAGIETRSPLTAGYTTTQFFVRASVDQTGRSESSVLRALTTDVTAKGLSNFLANIGRPLHQLVAQWAVSVVTDGLPGFRPSNPVYEQPSWNIRDVFLGIKRLGWDSADFPVASRAVPSGTVNIAIPTVVAGSTAVIEFTPMVGTAAALTISGTHGRPLDPGVRVALVRVR